MADENRRSGILYVKKQGKLLDVKGNWTYNLGKPKRDAIVGADRVHGYKELPQVAYVEGVITDKGSLDLENDILNVTDETLTLELANGKTIVFREAYFAGEGDVTTEEAEIAVRFEAMSAEEV
jgi:hypothetical protein